MKFVHRMIAVHLLLALYTHCSVTDKNVLKKNGVVDIEFLREYFQFP